MAFRCPRHFNFLSFEKFMSYLLVRDIKKDVLMTRIHYAHRFLFIVSVGQMPVTAVGYRDAKKAALEYLNGCPDRKIVGMKPPASHIFTTHPGNWGWPSMR